MSAQPTNEPLDQPKDENKATKTEVLSPEKLSDVTPVLPELIKDIPDAPKSVVAKGMISFEASFESGEQTTHKIYFPYPVYITEARAQVTKALAATNAGTITLKNNAGTAMATGVITFAASSALATLGYCKPTSKQGISATQYLQITVAKTTAGGRARVVIYFTKLL